MPENNQILSVESQLVGLPLAGPESFTPQQLDYLKRALGVDETVLWSGDASPNGTTKVGDLSESINNFEYYEVHAAFEGLYPSTVTKFKVPSQWFLNPNTSVYMGGIARAVSLKPQENNTVMDAFIAVGFGGANLTELYILGGRVIDGYTNGSVTCGAYFSSLYHIFKIIGIHRISGGNE